MIPVALQKYIFTQCKFKDKVRFKHLVQIEVKKLFTMTFLPPDFYKKYWNIFYGNIKVSFKDAEIRDFNYLK